MKGELDPWASEPDLDPVPQLPRWFGRVGGGAELWSWGPTAGRATPHTNGQDGGGEDEGGGWKTTQSLLCPWPLLDPPHPPPRHLCPRLPPPLAPDPSPHLAEWLVCCPRKERWPSGPPRRGWRARSRAPGRQAPSGLSAPLRAWLGGPRPRLQPGPCRRRGLPQPVVSNQGRINIY